MITNQKKKLLQRKNPNIIGGCVFFFSKILEWLEGTEMKKESTRKNVLQLKILGKQMKRPPNVQEQRHSSLSFLNYMFLYCIISQWCTILKDILETWYWDYYAEGYWVNWWLRGTAHHAHQWLQGNKLYESSDNKREWNLTHTIAPGQPRSYAECSR